MDIERFVEEEAAWLAKQEAGVRKDLLSLYAETSAEMDQALRANARDTYNRRHIRATQAQLDVLIQEMGDRQVDVLGKSVQLTFERQLFREKDAWQALEQAFGSPRAAAQFAGIKPIVPQRAVKALLTASTVSIKGFTDDMERDTRRVVGRSMLAGEGMAKTVKRLRQVKDIPKQPARLHLIGRMETARASNAGKQEFVDQVNEEFPELELWLMIKGRVDKTAETRNHWLTWAINGTVRNVTLGEYFEVHHAQLTEARAEYTAATRRKTYSHGILWKKFELGLRSQSLPSHFNDRDVLVAWRPSWGEMAGPVKHPQGRIVMMQQGDDGVFEVRQPDADLPIGNYDAEQFAKFKPPGRRHFLNSMTSPRDKNALVAGIKPGEIREEVRQIHQGLAHRQADLSFLIPSSGRVYEHDNKQFLPILGEGIYALTRAQYALLAQFAKDREKGVKTMEVLLEKGVITSEDAAIVLRIVEKHLENLL